MSQRNMLQFLYATDWLVILFFPYLILLKVTQLSRLGTSDDMEHNLSTFTTEMKEISYILSNITSRSLVIIDELGRGTSNIDGILSYFHLSSTA